MTAAELRPTNLAQAIPAKARKAVYSGLATLVALEAIFDVVPDVWEGRILSTLVVLGFGVAVSNTPKLPDNWGE